MAAFDLLLEPIIAEFDPDLIIVSAGYDAAEGVRRCWHALLAVLGSWKLPMAANPCAVCLAALQHLTEMQLWVPLCLLCSAILRGLVLLGFMQLLRCSMFNALCHSCRFKAASTITSHCHPGRCALTLPELPDRTCLIMSPHPAHLPGLPGLCSIINFKPPPTGPTWADEDQPSRLCTHDSPPGALRRCVNIADWTQVNAFHSSGCLQRRCMAPGMQCLTNTQARAEGCTPARLLRWSPGACAGRWLCHQPDCRMRSSLCTRAAGGGTSIFAAKQSDPKQGLR